MKRILLLLPMLWILSCTDVDVKETSAAPPDAEQVAEYGLVIHGGAGTILKSNMTPEQEEAYHSKMSEALSAGYKVLESGGSAEDAVVATIMIMEDSELFNSGKGAVFTHDERVELDASFMSGNGLKAGAVGGVTTVKNPILAARGVLEKSNHVMLSGAGADEFAKSIGLELVDNEYFHTERRYKSLQKAKNSETGDISILTEDEHKYGTVGACALDKNGNLAAGTSTGGMTNKRYGRIGDSPIIGAGTYANNNTCAISCTGHGEYFIRYAVAHDVSAMMEYTDATLEEAGIAVINEKLVEAGGTGGLVSIDKHGNISMPFNTEGMYRGYVLPDGDIRTFIYKD